MTVVKSKSLSGHQKLDEIFSRHDPNEQEQDAMRHIRFAAKAFALVLHEAVPRCSARDRAIRKVDEAMMIANAAIARRGVCY